MNCDGMVAPVPPIANAATTRTVAATERDIVYAAAPAAVIVSATTVVKPRLYAVPIGSAKTRPRSDAAYC